MPNPMAAIVIPARLDSTRFAGKVLADIAGKPMIQHVYERASMSTGAAEVIIATDSHEVMDAAKSFDAKAILTSDRHTSGTDRIAEVAATMDGYDIIVNVQGDEPLISAGVIDLAIGLLNDERADMGTVVSTIDNAHDMADPNVVKAVLDNEGFALYFSRAAIPYRRDADGGCPMYRHIGIYSYRRPALLKLSRLSPTALEQAEKLEQLRALENAMKIKVAVTEYESLGVDTPEDLERVKKCLSTSL